MCGEMGVAEVPELEVWDDTWPDRCHSGGGWALSCPLGASHPYQSNVGLDDSLAKAPFRAWSLMSCLWPYGPLS